MDRDALVASLVKIYGDTLSSTDTLFSEAIERAIARFPYLQDKVLKIKEEDLNAVLDGTLNGAIDLSLAIRCLGYLDGDSQKVEGFPAQVTYNLHSILGSVRRGSYNPYTKLCGTEADFWKELLGALADGAFNKLPAG
jgi:hypothetical protein